MITRNSKPELRTPNSELRGFTLIELMISVALVLILMIGINQVFKLTGEATGAGQVQADGIRNSRAIGAVMGRDIGAISGEAPAMLLRSQRIYAFRNRADQLTDRDDVAATVDTNNNNVEGEVPAVSPGEQIAPAIYNNRSHRIDIFSFFASDLFQRQTGNDGYFVSDMSSYEAWVWYGHLWLPNNDSNPAGRFVPYNPQTGAGTYPGTGAFSGNPNNIYGSQWTLGRMVTLLRQPVDTNNDGVPDTIYDNSKPSPGVPQHFIGRPSVLPVLPLQTGTIDYLSGTNTFATASSLESLVPANPPAKPYQIYESRYDVAGVDMHTFGDAVRDYIEHTSAHSQTPQATPTYPDDWWSRLMLDCRFQCDPFLIDPFTGNRALNSATMARQAPYFVGHVSQFIVEYAGDFLKQDTNPANTTTFGDVQDTYKRWDPSKKGGVGDYVDGSSDNEVDFVVINRGTPQQRREIRWYGMPRSTTGNATITALNGDVVPLRDLWQLATTVAPTQATARAPFERDAAATAFGPSINLVKSANYLLSMQPTDFYTCAWGPDKAKDKRPSMVRIIVTIDDPSGRLADGQTFEYVFKVPG